MVNPNKPLSELHVTEPAIGIQQSEESYVKDLRRIRLLREINENIETERKKSISEEVRIFKSVFNLSNARNIDITNMTPEQQEVWDRAPFETQAQWMRIQHEVEIGNMGQAKILAELYGLDL